MTATDVKMIAATDLEAAVDLVFERAIALQDARVEVASGVRRGRGGLSARAPAAVAARSAIGPIADLQKVRFRITY
jgi:hypothetical protein